MKLKDKVAIVTGGANGIGRAFVMAYANEGAKTVIADIDYQAAKETEKALTAKGYESLPIKVDVRNEEDTLTMALKSIERFGKIDILVNNAGIVSRGGELTRNIPFHELSLDEWDKIIAVNVRGPFLCCRAVFPYMKSQGSGKIINMASAQFINIGCNIRYAHYITSKGAVVGLTRALSTEVGEYNINVNCIAPGSTLSEESDDEKALQLRERAIADRSIKRVEYPEDLVGTAIFLASADSDFITGQTIVVDGGGVFV